MHTLMQIVYVCGGWAVCVFGSCNDHAGAHTYEHDEARAGHQLSPFVLLHFIALRQGLSLTWKLTVLARMTD